MLHRANVVSAHRSPRHHTHLAYNTHDDVAPIDANANAHRLDQLQRARK
jgi:hypothetical protein